MTAKLFEAALGIAAPWSVNSVEFDEAARLLTVVVDFEPGTHFLVSGHEGTHPVRNTVAKTYRHLNFFQHECHLHVRTPRVKLSNGSVRLAAPDFAGRLSGFTLLVEALVLMLAQQMPFAAVARIVGESARRVMEVCNRYVEMALGLADFGDVTALAIDELPNVPVTFDNSTTFGTPTPRWTGHGASNSVPKSPSKACAGRCSRTATTSSPRPPPISTH